MESRRAQSTERRTSKVSKRFHARPMTVSRFWRRHIYHRFITWYGLSLSHFWSVLKDSFTNGDMWHHTCHTSTRLACSACLLCTFSIIKKSLKRGWCSIVWITNIKLFSESPHISNSHSSYSLHMYGLSLKYFTFTLLLWEKERNRFEISFGRRSQFDLVVCVQFASPKQMKRYFQHILYFPSFVPQCSIIVLSCTNLWMFQGESIFYLSCAFVSSLPLSLSDWFWRGDSWYATSHWARSHFCGVSVADI